MKIQKDEAMKRAEELVKSHNIPYNSVQADHVDAGYWLVMFKYPEEEALMDGNVTFVTVDDESGIANLRPHP